MSCPRVPPIRHHGHVGSEKQFIRQAPRCTSARSITHLGLGLRLFRRPKDRAIGPHDRSRKARIRICLNHWLSGYTEGADRHSGSLPLIPSTATKQRPTCSARPSPSGSYDATKAERADSGRPMCQVSVKSGNQEQRARRANGLDVAVSPARRMRALPRWSARQRQRRDCRDP